jgi:low affinity Fe/Cu permease
MKDLFHTIAQKTSEIVGSAGAFVVAIAVILAWAVTGPIFGYSDTWQLAINTGTTIVTFLMVFLIQNTQNRDAKARIKLDNLSVLPSTLETGWSIWRISRRTR